MKVHGIEINDKTIEAATARMESGSFTSGQLADKVRSVQANVSGGYTAHRVADRLIQRARKAGLITYDGRVWHWGAPLPETANERVSVQTALCLED